MSGARVGEMIVSTTSKYSGTTNQHRALLAQRSEAGANFVAKNLRLFPCREMPALGDLVVMHEFGIRLLRSWAQQAYPKLVHYNKVAKGGHFAAWEQPKIF